MTARALTIPPAALAAAPAMAGASAVKTADRHADIIHTSLAGMTAIVLLLLAALALPVVGLAPVKQLWAFGIMVLAALGGIGGLYYMNFRVHRHVSDQARLTEVLVNSLGQGFLSFDAAGICDSVYSQACADLLEGVPVGRNIIDVLHVGETQSADFRDWLDILFMPHHALSFDDVVAFLPKFYPHGGQRRVSLVYRPIRDAEGVLTRVVVIATDETEEFEAEQRAKVQQNYADMICRIFKERNQFLATITHIRKFSEAAARPVKRSEGAPFLRLLHTLKAAVKYFHMDALGDVIHKLENDLRADTATSDADFQACLRAGQVALDQGLNAVLNQVRDLIGQDYEGKGNTNEVEESVLYDFAQDMQNHRIDPALIRRYLSTIAAVPVDTCFGLFERELRDLAEITGKQVKPIRYTGTNPRVLTRPIQEFILSLTHICRNIVDHGIEPSVTRLARGKDPEGQVSIHTDLLPGAGVDRGEWLHIVISDDGNGVDPSKVRAKLATVDPHGKWRLEDDQAVIQHIFSWGFSTRDAITDLSGHGVGMEAVEREVQLLGGAIRVSSELYKGTRFDIRVPHSLALNRSTALETDAFAGSQPVLRPVPAAGI